MAPLACSVRDCGAPLERDPQQWICPRGHTHDISRHGYVNLLQPQDRRSLEAGDPRDAVEARFRLLEQGLGGLAIAHVADAAQARLGPERTGVVAEMGCGTGHLLRALAGATRITGVGIDLSTRAIELAARQASTVQWVVANADRRLPLVDGTVSVLLSVHARRNPAEAERVLAPGGHLIVAIPAEDDLIELREAVQGDGTTRDRVGALIAEHAPHFTDGTRTTVRERRRLDGDQLRDLLAATYRGARHAVAARVAALDRLDVTFASEVVVFRRR